MSKRKEFYNAITSQFEKSSKEFLKNDVIFKKGSKKPKVYLIKSGVVRVVDTSKNRTNQVMTILQSGEAFPLVWGFDDPPAAAYRYEALSDVELFEIDLREFKNLMEIDPKFTKLALEVFVHLSWDLLERVKDLQMNYTTDKLLRALPFIAAKTGKKVSKMKFRIPEYITQSEIAMIIGTSRESVSTHMKKPEVKEAFYVKNDYRVIDLSNVESEFIYKRWFSEK